MVKDKGSHSQSWIEDIDMDKLEDLTNRPMGELYSYKYLCDYVGIPKLSGNSKIKQLNELSCICEYEKVNGKFNVICIRDKNDIVTYKSNNKYTTYIELVLSTMFRNCDKTNDSRIINGVLFMSSKQLAQDSGLVNSNLIYSISGENQVSKNYIISSMNGWKYNELYSFNNTTYMDVIKPILRTALKSLDNRKSIVIQRGYKLAIKNDNGMIIYKPIVSTSSQGQEIEHIIGDVYSELGIKTSKDLFLLPKVDKDKYNKRCRELCMERLGYDYFIECYAIVMNPSRIDYNIDTIKSELNQNVVNRIYDVKDKYSNVSASHFDELIDACVKIDTDYNFKSDIKDFYKKKR